jgi:hypothetical protein
MAILSKECNLLAEEAPIETNVISECGCRKPFGQHCMSASIKLVLNLGIMPEPSDNPISLHAICTASRIPWGSWENHMIILMFLYSIVIRGESVSVPEK